MSLLFYLILVLVYVAGMGITGLLYGTLRGIHNVNDLNMMLVAAWFWPIGLICLTGVGVPLLMARKGQQTSIGKRVQMLHDLDHDKIEELEKELF